MSEKNLLNKIQLLATSMGHRLFRNNCGSAFTGKFKYLNDGSVLIESPRRISFGLGTGTGDLIGGTRIKVTQDMVGKYILVFTNYEVKTKNVRLTKEQKAFHEMVNSLGGLSLVDRFLNEDIGNNSYGSAINRFQGSR